MSKQLLLLITLGTTALYASTEMIGMNKYERRMRLKELNHKIRILSQQIDQMNLQKERLRRIRDEATEQLYQIRKIKSF